MKVLLAVMILLLAWLVTDEVNSSLEREKLFLIIPMAILFVASMVDNIRRDMQSGSPARKIVADIIIYMILPLFLGYALATGNRGSNLEGIGGQIFILVGE